MILLQIKTDMKIRMIMIASLKKILLTIQPLTLFSLLLMSILKKLKRSKLLLNL